MPPNTHTPKKTKDAEDKKDKTDDDETADGTAKKDEDSEQIKKDDEADNLKADTDMTPPEEMNTKMEQSEIKEKVEDTSCDGNNDKVNSSEQKDVCDNSLDQTTIKSANSCIMVECGKSAHLFKDTQIQTSEGITIGYASSLIRDNMQSLFAEKMIEYLKHSKYNHGDILEFVHEKTKHYYVANLSGAGLPLEPIGSDASTTLTVPLRINNTLPNFFTFYGDLMDSMYSDAAFTFTFIVGKDNEVIRNKLDLIHLESSAVEFEVAFVKKELESINVAHTEDSTTAHETTELVKIEVKVIETKPRSEKWLCPTLPHRWTCKIQNNGLEYLLTGPLSTETPMLESLLKLYKKSDMTIDRKVACLV
eukprot:Platyproteum_vivax@DN6993_c0_g1_i6.p1